MHSMIRYDFLSWWMSLIDMDIYCFFLLLSFENLIFLSLTEPTPGVFSPLRVVDPMELYDVIFSLGRLTFRHDVIM